MKPLRRLLHLVRARHHARSLATEMEHHRSLIQADLEQQGFSTAEAAAESRRRMGNALLLREDSHEVWAGRWPGLVWRDLKYGARGLGREPVFAVSAVLTIALGIATTTTAFSIADAELWRPLPYDEPGRLVSVTTRAQGERRQPIEGISGAEMLQWREGLPGLSQLAARGERARRILQLDTAELVVVQEVTGNYFETLGRRPLAGRVLTARDASGSNAAVLTERALKQYFGGDFGVIGRSLVVDDRSLVVVGIVEAIDAISRDPDLFVAIDEKDPAFIDRETPRFYASIFGLLAPGVPPETVQAQLEALIATRTNATASASTAHVEGLLEFHTGWNWRPLYFFLGASLVVLLLSTVNVAALLLSRAFGRRREFALRGALGGGTGALIRQLLVEGALVAVPGALLALMLTSWAVAAVAAEFPADLLSRSAEIPVDRRAAAFAVTVTAVATVVFVLAPLAVARRVNLSGGGLREGGRSGPSLMEKRVRVGLLLAQMALTMVLLSGSGIFMKSFYALSSVPLGFEADNKLAMRTSLSGPRYQTPEAVRRYADELKAQAEAVPGVGEVAIGTSSPLGSGPLVNYIDSSEPVPPPADQPRAILRAVSPSYFRTLGIPLLKGRAFETADGSGAQQVAIINEALANETLGESNPLGQALSLLGGRVSWTRQPGPRVVVGVVPNVKEVGINEVSFPSLYVPFAQMPAPSFELIAATAVPPGDLSEPLRQAAAGVDPTVPITRFVTFEQRLGRVLQKDRFNLMLITAFAVAAIGLAGIGVFGTVSYAVQERTREMGVRLALGAHPPQLFAMTVRQAVKLGLAGATLGLGATLLGARLLGSSLYLVPGSHNGLLYGVSTTDPIMLSAAFAGLVCVALAAGAVPARRAAQLDPVRAIRCE